MAIQVVGGWAFDTLSQDAYKPDLSPGPKWWVVYPSFPNQTGINAFVKRINALKDDNGSPLPWLSGRKTAFKLGTGPNPSAILQFLNLDGDHVVLEFDIGLECDALAREGDASYSQNLKSKLENTSESATVAGGN